ncbi:uncharacterized protein HD556DRAFT_1196846, partial [Suillus plorans]
HLGWTPCRLPPLTPDRIQKTHKGLPADIVNALEAIVSLKTHIADAHDALLASKISQANTANKHGGKELTFEIGNLVYLSTAHRRREYLNGDNKRVAK